MKSPILILLAVASCSRIPPMGSVPVTSLPGDRFAEIAWSPDGNAILASGLPYLPSTQNDLFLVDLERSDANKITELPDQFSHPSWSPHGTAVVLTVDVTEIWTIDVATKERSYVTDGESATWMPDGQHLVVYVGNLGDRASSERLIHFVDLKGNIEGTLPLREVNPAAASSQATTSSAPEETAWLNPLGTREFPSALSLSPDGKRLVFSLAGFEGSTESHVAFMANLETGELTQFVPGQPVGTISWSPDGTSIAYISLADIGNTGSLVIADIAGECLQRPDLAPEVSTVTWSPDGKAVALLIRGEVYVLDLGLNTPGANETNCD